MAETLQQTLDYINEILPNKMNSTTIITLINNEQRKLWRNMTSTSLYEMYTVANQEIYTLPTDCDFEMITENGILVAGSTTGSTNQTFTAYKYAGKDDYAGDYVYYEALDETFGIIPIPTVSNKPIHIRYQPRPTLFASTDTAVQFNLDEDYIDLIKFRVMSRICKSGNNPDPEMANNYEADAMELERKMKLRKARDKMKTRRRTVSYMEGWNR
jgi:hypothetical protein